MEAVLTLLLGKFVAVSNPSVPSMACSSSFSCRPELRAKRSEPSRPAKRAASVRRYENEACNRSGASELATNVASVCPASSNCPKTDP